MVYKNPFCKKIRGSHILIVSCGFCKQDIAKYQKLGRGNLLRMHIDRIIKGAVDFGKKPKALICPNCGEQLANRIFHKRKRKDVYRMIRARFNTREG